MTAIWSSVAGRSDANALALVHGSLDRSAGLLRLSRRLAPTHRVLRYDRRGYGRSAPHGGPFAMVDHVADLAALLADGENGSTPWVLVGHSYGGNVALATAERHPDLVAAVVIYESPLSWLPWWPSGTAGAGAVAAASAPADAAEAFMRRMIGDARWEGLPPSARARRRREGVALVGELTDLRVAAPWNPDRIDVPVLAMCGSRGRDYHRRAAETVAAEIDGAEFAVVDGAGHGGPNTHSGEVAELVGDFVRRRAEPLLRR